MTTLTIFLHGIGSSSDTWTNFIRVMHSDSDTSTLQSYVPNSTSLNDGADYYYLYDYKSEIISKGSVINRLAETFSGNKTSGNISFDNHVSSFRTFIDLNTKGFKKINIVAHSMGGVVTMKLLLDVKKSTDVTDKVGTVILYGAPLKGSNNPAELEKVLGKTIPSNILGSLKPDSLTITSLNQGLENEKKYLKENFDIYYVKGDSDSRIVELSNFDVEKFGKIQNIQGGHSEIINPSNINDQSFVCFKECFYNGSKKKLDKKTSISNKKFTDKRFISDKEGSKIELVENHVECVFTFDFLEFLGSVDVLANEHPDKEKVVLEDIYVYPLVERYYDLEASKKSVDSKKLVEKFTTSKLLIAGESQSGKTSLCKMLIQELKKKKLIPIYLTDDKNPHEGRIEKRLIEAYNSQYSSDCEFKDISLDKIIPVIDNFHTAKKKEKIITDLSCFPSTVLIVDDLFSLNLSQDSLLSKYTHYRIKEYSPSLRNEIIKKWMGLSDGGISSNEKYELLDNKSELVENSLGKIIGNGIMPAYPFFILTIISTFDTFDKPLDQEITSQGYCYQALIYSYLRKQEVKSDDIDTYINFLTQFSYFFFKEKKREVSKDEFNVFLKSYLDEFNLPINEETLVNKLSKIKIITLDGFNNYSFSYPYLYYFFVAKYLSENPSADMDQLIDEMIDSLHKNENAYILTFISHHSKDDLFLNKLLYSADNLYGAFKPSTLCTEELAFFDGKVNEIIKAVLPNGQSSPEQERIVKLKRDDEREEGSDLHKNSNSEIEYNEGYLNLRKSIKTVEVMGHIIKNRAGSLKKEKLELLFISAIKVNLRIIREFIELIEKKENQDEILSFFKGRIHGYLQKNGQKNISKSDADKIAVKLFWNTNFFLISTLINKAVHSLGSDKLIGIVNSVCEKEDTPASFLINHGILMWYRKNIQTDNIVRRIEKNDFSPVSKRILDFMVANHCSFHQVKTKDLQKIENKLGIRTGKLRSPFQLVKNH